jgi:hypothetical protein
MITVSWILNTFIELKFIMAHALLSNLACCLIFYLICKLRMKATNLFDIIVFVLLEVVNEIFNRELDHEK